MTGHESRRYFAAAAVSLIGAIGFAAADEPTLPVVDGAEVVASVNGEPILLDELYQQLGVLHESVERPQELVQRPDPLALLHRMINAKLILQEARNIGLDELPEYQRRLEATRLFVIRKAISREYVKDIESGDPDQIERLYRDAVREANVRSVIVSSKDDAEALSTAVAAGGDFAALAAALVERGKATGLEGPHFLKVAEMLPEVGAVVVAMKSGSVSSPIQVQSGFVVVELIEIRYPDDAEARSDAETSALELRRQERLRAQMDALRVRYAKIDKTLVQSLQFSGGSSTLEQMRADRRVLAEIKGGEPITVADLTEELGKKFFHGFEGAIERGRVDAEIPGVLDRMILERAANLEAQRLGIEGSAGFASAMRSEEDALLFNTFISKVINPEIALREEELKTYYGERADEFASPSMVRLESLAFTARADAEAALGKLRSGADFTWMRANADGQVDSDRDDVKIFNGKLIAEPALTDGIRDAISGASSGDLRFYAEPNGPYHVIFVKEIFPSQTQPYEQVRQEIAARLFARKRGESIERWADRLKEASEVEIFVGSGELRRILGLSSEESQ